MLMSRRGAALVLLVFGLIATERVAADEPQPASPVQQLLDAVHTRLAQVETEVERLKRGTQPVPAEPESQRVAIEVESPYLGQVYFEQPQRFFAAKLTFVNLTPEPVTIRRDNLFLITDGERHAFEPVPLSIRFHHAFSLGDETLRLIDLVPPEELTIASGESGTTWVLFTHLPAGANLVQFDVEAKAGEKTWRVDVTAIAREALKLTVERIGPQSSLALLTIAGELNTINVGSLVDELDRLAAQRVARAVIRWTDDAAQLDQYFWATVEKAIDERGQSEADPGSIPDFPAAMRELHIANVPEMGVEGEDTKSRQADWSEWRHETDVEAVAAALRTAYESLPSRQLLAEIRTGHPLTRAAAIIGGGGRLGRNELPLLLELARSDDREVQRAALMALRHFGEADAIAVLLEQARSEGPARDVAIESLAGSRFATAHETLLSLLQDASQETRKVIVRSLARHPRPLWSDALFSFASDPKSEVAGDALAALVRMGHPQLMHAFQVALDQGNEALQTRAFDLLVQRTDAESEDLAMEYALRSLQEQPPSGSVIALLQRTKDRRALPMLLARFDENDEEHSELITLLGEIGDQAIADELVKRFDTFEEYERSNALQALARLHSPDFRRLAKQTLEQDDSVSLSAATDGLVSDGSSEAVKILAAALKPDADPNVWVVVTNALATIGTNEARSALQSSRAAAVEERQDYLRSALQQIERNSPGYQHVLQGHHHTQQEEWGDAIASYTLAIEIDGQLAEAWSSRANIYLKQDKIAESKTDYQKALEVDPDNSIGLTGIASVQIAEGAIEKGIATAEEGRGRFSNDAVFVYNVACVYGRAIQQLHKRGVKDDDKTIVGYREKALADLRQSVVLGFRDLEFIKKDPDLNPLHGQPAFESIVTGEFNPDDEPPPAADDQAEG